MTKETEIKKAFEEGFKSGVESIERKILSVCDTDKPIEIDGRAYFVQSDIKHLHKLFDDIERNNK